MHSHASLASKAHNPDGLTVDQIMAEMMAHIVPNAIMIPSAVGELVRLQDKGFRLVVEA